MTWDNNDVWFGNVSCIKFNFDDLTGNVPKSERAVLLSSCYKCVVINPFDARDINGNAMHTYEQMEHIVARLLNAMP